MRRIATPTRALNKFGPGRDGFNDGDPITGTPATDLQAAWFDAVQEEIAAVAEFGDGELDPADSTQLLQGIQRIVNAASEALTISMTALLAAKAPLASPALTGAPTAPTQAAGNNTTRVATTAFVMREIANVQLPAYSIAALPTSDKGPVIVAEAAEVWLWTETAYFEGYRSPLCGRPVDGHTVSPLIAEVDAVGGLVSKTTYARLWAYAQENGLVVSEAEWTAAQGAHYFVDVSGSQFRMPDLRNMFRRYTGTDADTANARTFGSLQRDALQGFGFATAISGITTSDNVHAISQATNWGFGGTASGSAEIGYLSKVRGGTINAIGDDGHGEPRVSMESRSINAAFHPRVHV